MTDETGRFAWSAKVAGELPLIQDEVPMAFLRGGSAAAWAPEHSLGAFNESEHTKALQTQQQKRAANSSMLVAEDVNISQRASLLLSWFSAVEEPPQEDKPAEEGPKVEAPHQEEE